MNSIDEKIDQFLGAECFAVVGASQDPHKYGHMCYKTYLEHGRKVYPINPKTESILGNQSYKSLAALPERVESISIITPPYVTEAIVEEAIACGVKNIWMQPGAESDRAVTAAENAGLNVIYGGPCLLVVMRRL